jgi:hypothetical protein
MGYWVVVHHTDLKIRRVVVSLRAAIHAGLLTFGVTATGFDFSRQGVR